MGCNIAKDKRYYSQFRNINLEYEWDFNPSISGGGHTYNSTYFQVKKYNIFQELFLLKIPYEIHYKHEEGHIFHKQLQGIEDLDTYNSEKFELLNLSNHDSYRQYILSVSEGIADYYVINYFNNSMSDKYYEYIQENKKDGVTGFKQHYQGIEFITYVLNNNIYENFTEIIFDFSTKNQYLIYSDYLSSG